MLLRSLNNTLLLLLLVTSVPLLYVLEIAGLTPNTVSLRLSLTIPAVLSLLYVLEIAALTQSTVLLRPLLTVPALSTAAAVLAWADIIFVDPRTALTSFGILVRMKSPAIVVSFWVTLDAVMAFTYSKWRLGWRLEVRQSLLAWR